MGGTACQEWGRHACVRGYLIYLSNNFIFYISFLIDQQEDLLVQYIDICIQSSKVRPHA